MEVGHLCDAVDEWQAKRISDLEKNSICHPDMAWEIEGSVLPDCKQPYCISPFLRTLFSTPMNSGSTRKEDGLDVYPIEEKSHVFNMIRVFCHTGLIVFVKGEPILRTIERYAAFHFYGIEEGRHVMKRLVMDNLTPGNAVMAFEYAVHRHDEDLLFDIKTYISNYAFLVLRHKNFFNLRKESMIELIQLCMSDKLNVPEVDLLSNLYRLCEKKMGDKDFSEFSRAFDLLTYRFGDHSMWDSVRLTSISMEEFMLFVQKHPSAMTNDDIVKAMKTIYQCTTSSDVPRKRKKFQTVSTYPRNLNFRGAQNPEVEVAHWESNMVQAFLVFDFGKMKSVSFPSISYGDRHVRCTVTSNDRTLGLRGHVTRKPNSAASSREGEDVKFSVSIVNFRHDRWKKTSACVKLTPQCEFDIPNILSCNAIEGTSGTPTGYAFDIDKYPEYSEDGSWLMISVVIEGL